MHCSFLLLYCITIMVFKDCQSFFLRHSQTGKCIRTGDLVYDKPSQAVPYWAVMTDNCLDPKAQFRFLASEFVQHVNTRGNFHSTDATVYRNRLAIYRAVSSSTRPYQNNPDQCVKQTTAGSLFFYKMSKCYQPDSAKIYFEAVSERNCDKPGQQFTFGSVTSYNDKVVNVGCSPVQLMDVKKADYGNFNRNLSSPTTDATCSIIANCQVKSRCNGKKSCELTLDNKLLLPEYCSDTSKEIYTKYTCVDDVSSITSITSTGENLRLNKANEGYIEIKDHGSKWRKVDDKSWDQDRQKMLCQHLGFDVTDKNELSNRGSGKNQDIATGDLIFYKQSDEISCCAAMEGSNTGNTDVSIPYVKCKICDNPLLRNYTLFPDTVFSGGGSKNFEKARLYDSGWCSFGRSGPAYLTIDLQKEYHISQVVTMCRDDQKWCSGSYSLQYSHNKTFVDGSSGENICIRGNQKGYQASRTTVSIYNVRHIKIVTEKRGFCLRIELCGEVQTPAPVQKMTVSPSSFSALVSWTLLGHDKSSYITEYAVRLNGVDLPRISRKMYENKYTVTNLTPNTRYTFEIRTLDGSLQQSSTVTKEFKTTNAGEREASELSSDEKTRLDLKIPITILSLCLLLSLGVILYLHKSRRRLLQNKNKHLNQKPETSRTFDENQRLECSQAEQEDSYMIVDNIYARPDEVLDHDERNNTESRAECSTEQEALACMSLKDSRELGKFYQPLQHPGKVSNQAQTNGNEQTTQFENPTFSANFNSVHESDNEYDPLEHSQAKQELSYVIVVDTYARPDEALDHDERNNTESRPESSTEQEALAYMSLKDSREPGKFYQPLEHPGKISGQAQTKGNEQTTQFENPTFNANFSSAQESDNEYDPSERSQAEPEVSYVIVDDTYARLDEALDHDERNNTESRGDSSTEQEALVYMSLKDS